MNNKQYITEEELRDIDNTDPKKKIVYVSVYQPNLWKVDLSKVINQEIQYAWKKKRRRPSQHPSSRLSVSL